MVIITTQSPAISVHPLASDPGRSTSVAMALLNRMAICDCRSL